MSACGTPAPTSSCPRMGTTKQESRAGWPGSSPRITFGERLGSEVPYRSFYLPISPDGGRRLSSLHLQLLLQHRQSAAGHFYTADGIHGGLRRHPVAASHKEDLQEFGGLARIDQPSLQQIVPQRREFGTGKSLFHGRHHLRPLPLLTY